MHFNKPPTTIDEQIDLLIERGMQGDAALMRRWLETVGYYRLSAFWLPFEVPPADDKTRSKRFAAGLRFDTIVDIYVFDRKLRLLVMEAIERIEIAVRSRWTNRLPSALGGFDKDAVGCRSTRNGFSGELGDAPVLEVMKSIRGAEIRCTTQNCSLRGEPWA